MYTYLKKNYFYFVVATVFLLANYTCTSNDEGYENKETWAKHWLDINGRVKSVNYYKYSESDRSTHHSSYQFDKAGRFIEKNFKRGEKQVRITHKYNEIRDLSKIFMAVSPRSEFKEFENGILISKIVWTDSLDAKKQLVKQSKFVDDQLVSIVNLRYTSNGQLSSWKEAHLINGKHSVNAFFYDENHLLIKDSYLRFNRDSIQKRKIVTTYNSAGNKTSRVYFSGTNDFDEDTYKYNAQGKLVNYTSSLSNHVFYHEHSITYSKEGVKKDSTHRFYWSPNPEIEAISAYDTEIYQFNESNQLVHSIVLRKDSILSTTSYLFDDEGDLTKEKTEYPEGYTIVNYDRLGQEILRQDYNKKDSLLTEEKKEIEYDDHNNVTALTHFKNDTLQSVLKMQYSYY